MAPNANFCFQKVKPNSNIIKKTFFYGSVFAKLARYYILQRRSKYKILAVYRYRYYNKTDELWSSG